MSPTLVFCARMVRGDEPMSPTWSPLVLCALLVVRWGSPTLVLCARVVRGDEPMSLTWSPLVLCAPLVVRDEPMSLTWSPLVLCAPLVVRRGSPTLVLCARGVVLWNLLSFVLWYPSSRGVHLARLEVGEGTPCRGRPSPPGRRRDCIKVTCEELHSGCIRSLVVIRKVKIILEGEVVKPEAGRAVSKGEAGRASKVASQHKKVESASQKQKSKYDEVE